MAEWNVWGLDNIGKLLYGNISQYYFKDHLGSVRVIVDNDNRVTSAQDYDAWGYLLEGRTFDSDDSKYKFTSKERDKENNYDFSAVGKLTKRAHFQLKLVRINFVVIRFFVENELLSRKELL